MRPHSKSRIGWFGGAILVASALNARCAAEAFSNRPPGSEAQLHGSPARYMVDVERFRLGGACDVRNPAFYSIPQEAVTRATYLRCIEETKPKDIARNPEHGMDGPRAFMPVLAKYVETGDAKLADACIAMLKAFHAEMQKQVAVRKWFWQFEHPAALIPLYRKHLIRGGAMKADAD